MLNIKKNIRYTNKNILATGGFDQDGKILTDLFYKKKIRLNIISKNKNLNKKLLIKRIILFIRIQ